MKEFHRYYQYFYETLHMDHLKQDYPYDHEILELILRLVVEVMCSKRKQIRIASDDKPIEIVKSCFMKLDMEHIKFVMVLSKRTQLMCETSSSIYLLRYTTPPTP